MAKHLQTTTRRSPKKLYVPGVREPIHLPAEQFELPVPEPLPPEPRPFSWLTMLTPAGSVVISIVTAVISGITGNQTILLLICPTVAMAMIPPITNLVRTRSEKKKYEQDLAARKQKYQNALQTLRKNLDAQVEQQRTILEHAYPPPQALLEIGLAQGKFRRLWFRRLGIDSDFLALRVGQYAAPPAFEISSQATSTGKDELVALSRQILQDYKKVYPLPFTLPLDLIGSLGVCGGETQAFHVIQRLLLDAFIHHSPTDLVIVVLSNRPDAKERWRIYKWLPHTRTLQTQVAFSGLAIKKKSIDAMLAWLVSEYDRRQEIDQRHFEGSDDIPYILTVFDDDGHLRQDPEISSIIKWGYHYRMPAIILGDQALPQIRARLDLLEDNKFRYIETWEGGKNETGTLDDVPMSGIPKVCRALAGLEMITESEQSTLPESLPLSMTVDDMWLSAKAVENNWQRQYQDNELLQFPAGVYIQKKDVVPLCINLLPAERGGFDAYHSILIGTTGSGKSEFMKSLVLAAAYRYPPDLLNFFFMDFKGGAAFDPFKELPHVSGIVTNLQPELVDRGLVAVQSEISRRQAQFANAQVRDIWAFNQLPGGERLPHLWLMLDEFAKGLADFPDLNPVLDLLVRQGRSLGMYLLLANQDVNNSVNQLLSNVGWRIALKVSRRDEMVAILEEKLDPTIRPGHGYLRKPQGDIVEFQSGYAGFKVVEEGAADRSESFEILLIEDNGLRKQLYEHKGRKDNRLDGKPKVSEQEKLIEVMTQATAEMKLPLARKIYHDPLPPEITLDKTLAACSVFRNFDQGAWSEVKAQDKFLVVPLGFNDHVESGRQFPLQIDFKDKDGHLWIVGAVGSGKELTLTSLFLSLAATHLPEEVQFYFIEGGSGALKKLKDLPHTGAVVRLSETERLQRLLAFFEAKIEKRQTEGFGPDSKRQGPQPHLFLVINNFADFRNSGLENLDKVSSLIQGGLVGIHLIFVSNLSRDIPGKLSSNLAHKLVLQQANKDEYLNFLPRNTAPLSYDVPGRGYWLDDFVSECQVAQPTMIDEEGSLITFEAAARSMQSGWDGEKPREIRTLPDRITMADYLQEFGKLGDIPVGVNFETLLPVFPKREELSSALLVLGETRSGKSNCLLNVIEHLHNQGGWEMHAICLRPSPLRKLSGQIEGLQVYASGKSAVEGMAPLPDKLHNNSALPAKILVLVDDLGSVFEAGQTEVDQLLDSLASELRQREQQDVLLVAAGQIDEFRMKVGTNTLIRLLSQNKTGLCLSQDMQAWGWMGVLPQDIRPYNKMTLPVGRGFFINRGSLQFVQTPHSMYSET